MRRAALIMVTLELCALFACLAIPSCTGAGSSVSCLENDLELDFSQTQFSFVGPMESWFVFKFKATNVGVNTILVHSDNYCEENPAGHFMCAPQGDTLLAPGEAMWFKMVLEPSALGYDPNVPQIINRTLNAVFYDRLANWDAPYNSFSVTKTIQITVVNQALQGNVVIQGVTVDEDGKALPNVNIDIGGYGAKLPVQSDGAGSFSFSLAESSVYFLIAQKDGYRSATVEIERDNLQPSYTVVLAREESTLTIDSSLIHSVQGSIGFWRCTATADESKLLLVNGMENWANEALKPQSKLYLLNTDSGQVIWTADMGWESWSADITDDGEYAVYGTKLEGFQTGPAGFINSVSLLDGEDGSTVWVKNITTQNFPNTTQGEFYTRAVKFSHSGDYIFVPVHYEYCYLLNREDGSIVWSKWVGSEVRELIFTENDQYIYIPTSGGWLYKVRTSDGSEVWKQWIGSWAFINGFNLSPNEAYIAVGTKGGTFSVINTQDGSVRFTDETHSGGVTCVFSPDSAKVLVGGNLLTMYDLDGNALWRCYQEGADVRFSADGTLIFTSNGGVFDSYGTLLYDILPSGDRFTKVGWINSDATRYIFAVQEIDSQGNIIEVYNIETQVTTEVTPTPTPTIPISPSSTPAPSSTLPPSLLPSSSSSSSNSPTPTTTPTIPELSITTIIILLTLTIPFTILSRKNKAKHL